MSIQLPVKTGNDQLFFVEVDGMDASTCPPTGAPGDSAPVAGYDPNRGPLGGAPMGDVVDKVLSPTAFAKAVELIQALSHDVSSGLLATSPRPSEVEMSLSLGFDASGNLWLLKGGAKANLSLTLKWKMP